MKVLLSEEVANRERIALLLLQHVLSKRGWETRLCPSWDIPRSVTRYEPDILLDNITTSIAHFAGKLLFIPPHTRVIDMMWEQLINPGNLQRFRFPRIVQERFVDGRICWGDAMRKTLVELNPAIQESRIRVIGSLKHFLNLLYLYISRDDISALVDRTLNPRSRTILLVTSFPLASVSIEGLDAIRGGNAPFIRDMKRFHCDARERFLALSGFLADKYRDYQFILRVHPSLDPAYRKPYEGVAANHNNIHLNDTGDISALLRISDCVFATSSGVLIDAYLQNVPAYNVRIRDHLIDRVYLSTSTENKFGTKLWFSEADEWDLDLLCSADQQSQEAARLIEKWILPGKTDPFEALADFVQSIFTLPPTRKDVPLLKCMFSLEIPKKTVKCLASRSGLTQCIKQRAVVDTPIFDRTYQMVREAYEKWKSLHIKEARGIRRVK